VRATSRIAFVVAGVLLGLALAEGTLQGLRRALGAGFAPDARATAHPGKVALLCVGDSHTYGLGVQRELQSFPVRLEVLLNGGRRDGPFVVENAGTPGNNTALVRWQARRALARGHWDAVFALAGFNDEWNLTEPPAGDAAEPEAKFLLPQLLRWIAFCLRPPPSAVDVVDSDGRGIVIRGPDGSVQPVNGDPASRPGLHSGADLAREVEAGLIALVRDCRRDGVAVVLQTYATRMNDPFQMASAGARVAAQKEHVPLVDQAAWFDEHGKGLAPDVLFQRDGHPNGTGYDLMARAIVAKLRELKAAGVKPFDGWPIAAEDAAGAPPPAEGPVAARELALEAARSDSPEVLRFALRGPAGTKFRVAFARARRPADGGATGPLGLERDALFAASLGADGLAGSFGADGRASAWTARDLFAAPAQAEAFAQLLALDSYAASAEAALRGASEVVAIPWPGK
jgi:lysophospholipase L1-like esterase